VCGGHDFTPLVLSIYGQGRPQKFFSGGGGAAKK